MRILSQGTLPSERQLQTEIVERCRQQIRLQAERRNHVRSREEWEECGRILAASVKKAFPSFLFDKKEKLVSRLVSQHDFGAYRVENVVFESFPGWEVNGTVYLPKQPGRYPGVVCPTGHSSKTRESYQVAAQVFAMNGYVAISFDPPGCAGEIQWMNDHFTNGLIGYLTGIWSNTHFVFDAIRCIDYLATRADVDMDGGVAMTGVSGGGATSVYASLLDERVSFFAPVCCLAEHESIHFTDLYTSCPEQFGPGFIGQGIDFVDLIAMQAPKPCLIVGGKLDEVFDYASTERLFQEISSVYRLYGQDGELGLFLQEDSGHAYTVEMASVVVRWMNRLLKKRDEPPLALGQEEVTIQAAEPLLCHPSNEVNMFTINRDEGRRLGQCRRRARLARARSGAETGMGASIS